jgi:hypothetical protein
MAWLRHVTFGRKPVQADAALFDAITRNWTARSQGNGLSHTRLLVSILNALGYDDTTFGNPEHAEGTVPGLVG